MTAKGSHGHGIEFEVSMESFPCGDRAVLSAGEEQAEGKFCLWQE